MSSKCVPFDGKAAFLKLSPDDQARIGALALNMIVAGNGAAACEGMRQERAYEDAQIAKRLHDLRGNAATELAQHLSDAELALIMGWSETNVARIRNKYVSRKAIVSATAARLARTKNERKL